MHKRIKSLLMSALIFSTTLQAMSMEEVNTDKKISKSIQSPTRVLNSNVAFLQTAPNPFDDVRVLIGLHALETRQDFHNFSRVSKPWYKAMHRIAQSCVQLSFLRRINAEAIDATAVNTDGTPMFQPNEFNRYFGLENKDGTLNIEAVKRFEQEKGTFVKLWLVRRYSNVFDKAFHKMHEEIERDSDAQSFNNWAAGSWFFMESGIKLVPRNILTVSNCTALGFPGCGLLDLPWGLTQLRNVTDLDLGNNNMETLPADTHHMTKLQKLTLAYNKFAVFPAAVLGMTNLVELSCGWEGGVCNLFGDLSSDLSPLTKLNDLSLTGCRFKSVPPQVSQLTGLNTFRIDNNGLEKVGPELFTLTGLTSLFLQNNKLSTLPGNVGNLVNVTWLFLCSNQLEELPEGFWQMKALKNLQLGNNKLKTLSESILTLPCLEELDVSKNEITVFPRGFSKMMSLTKLCLSNNPVEDCSALVLDLQGFNGRGKWSDVTFFSSKTDSIYPNFSYHGN